MKDLTRDKLLQIVKEEAEQLNERKVAMGEDGGYFKVQKGKDGTILVDVGEGRTSGERRVRLFPGEAQNLARTLERLS